METDTDHLNSCFIFWRNSNIILCPNGSLIVSRIWLRQILNWFGNSLTWKNSNHMILRSRWEFTGLKMWKNSFLLVTLHSLHLNHFSIRYLNTKYSTGSNCKWSLMILTKIKNYSKIKRKPRQEIHLEVQYSNTMKMTPALMSQDLVFQLLTLTGCSKEKMPPISWNCWENKQEKSCLSLTHWRHS